jgi:tetratricopeptide (TPR) repeat protein
MLFAKEMPMGGIALAILLIATTAPARNLAPTTNAAFAAVETGEQSSTQAPAQGATQASPQEIDALRRQAVDTFGAGNCAGALPILRQVIAADPGDIVAYNLSGNCSLNLGDYPAAIDSFRHALQLRPDEWHNLSGLMRAYTLAEMAPERDALRKHISELSHEGKLPPSFNYVFETFRAGDKKVEVAEFPQIQGFYGERYRFKVFNSSGKQIFCVTLESNSAEQPMWAQQHPKEAAAGARGFTLDGYASDSHSTYNFYDGEPPYEQVRAEVLQVLAGKKKATSKTTYATPQPIPGAD